MKYNTKPEQTAKHRHTCTDLQSETRIHGSLINKYTNIDLVNDYSRSFGNNNMLYVSKIYIKSFKNQS